MVLNASRGLRSLAVERLGIVGRAAPGTSNALLAEGSPGLKKNGAVVGVLGFAG